MHTYSQTSVRQLLFCKSINRSLLAVFKGGVLTVGVPDANYGNGLGFTHPGSVSLPILWIILEQP